MFKKPLLDVDYHSKYVELLSALLPHFSVYDLVAKSLYTFLLSEIEPRFLGDPVRGQVITFAVLLIDLTCCLRQVSLELSSGGHGV